jgi:hypothetical protein
VEIFVAIVPLAAVVAIAVWSGIHTYRLARPKLGALESLGGAAEQGHRA